MISKDEKASELPGEVFEYFNIIDKYFHKVFKILAQTILYVMDCMSLAFKPHNWSLCLGDLCIYIEYCPIPKCLDQCFLHETCRPIT